MPQDNSISKLLDMEHMIVKKVDSFSDSIVLHVEMERCVSECPVCGALTDKVHDYRTQRVKDAPCQGKNVFLEYRKRRYVCPCCNKRFYEKNHLIPQRHRITSRTTLFTLNELEKQQSRKDIAQRLNISESTVGRWLQLVDFSKPAKLPRVLSIDEFKGNTEYGKFQCILTDPVHRRTLDILPTIKGSDIYEFLSGFPNRKNVEYFITDMRKEYIAMAKVLFPNATIVIDRFHVVRYCIWALENVRKRVQKKLLPEQRKYFKRSRTLLLKRMDKLKPESKEAVERMLMFDRDLREAYLLKELFYRFMESETRDEAKQRLREFRLHAYRAEIPEFEACLTMLKNWEQYILNAFSCDYSNGFTEGCNNKIKVTK